MKTTHIFIVSLFLICTMIIHTGCSLIGYIIGDISDSKNVRTEIRPAAHQEINPGQEIRLELMNFNIIEGKYLGLYQHRLNPDSVFIVLEVNSKMTYVPNDSIHQISEIDKKKSKSGRLYGFFIGAVMDGLFIYFLVNIESFIDINPFNQ